VHTGLTERMDVVHEADVSVEDCSPGVCGVPFALRRPVTRQDLIACPREDESDAHRGPGAGRQHVQAGLEAGSCSSKAAS